MNITILVDFALLIIIKYTADCLTFAQEYRGFKKKRNNAFSQYVQTRLRPSTRTPAQEVMIITILVDPSLVIIDWSICRRIYDRNMASDKDTL